jgi:ribose transport system ATP-binding protein
LTSSETEVDAVRMRGISKSFGGIRALDQVDLGIRRGEIHALLGENGAGKSTILKILRGVQSPDAGTITINGVALGEVSTEAARRAGIAMIFQEMSLIPTLTVAQNIFLTHETYDRFGLIDDNAAVAKARALFAELGVEVDPKAIVGDLGTGQKQLTEIVKAMSQDARILVLDEPTSALTETEVERLFTFLRRLKGDGVAIIYVSHRMGEIMRIADRATILRDGRHVITAPLSELTLEAIITHIVGRRVRNFGDVTGPPSIIGEPLLRLAHVSGARRPVDVSLAVHRGEVVGISGLLGSGRSSLARLVAGLDPLVSGEIQVGGRTLHLRNAGDAIAAGIVLIPEDRIRQGVVVDHSVASNIHLPVLDRLSRWSWISNARAARLANEQIAHLRIKTASPDSAVRTLSGGNQQKVVLAKGLAATPEILILDEPTAGIDIGSKAEIIALIRDLARQGKAILLISSELSELLAASDRILVMSEGRIVRDIPRRELDAGADTPANPDHAERQLQIALQKARPHV